MRNKVKLLKNMLKLTEMIHIKRYLYQHYESVNCLNNAINLYHDSIGQIVKLIITINKGVQLVPHNHTYLIEVN